jgi:hypothetical protein
METRVPRAAGAEAGVLEDPSGGRARWLRRAGRVVFLVFLAWLLAILLGGLGLAPVPGIPFAHSLRPAGPPAISRLPKARPPSPADLRPALPASALAARTPARPSALLPGRGRSGLAPGRTRTGTTGAAPGRSGAAPGHTKTAPTVSTIRGRSSSSPGHTSTSRGHVKTTTSPGKKP